LQSVTSALSAKVDDPGSLACALDRGDCGEGRIGDRRFGRRHFVHSGSIRAHFVASWELSLTLDQFAKVSWYFGTAVAPSSDMRVAMLESKLSRSHICWCQMPV